MSKQGLKPNRSQSDFIRSNKIKLTRDGSIKVTNENCLWLVQKDTSTFMQIINKETGEEKILYK